MRFLRHGWSIRLRIVVLAIIAVAPLLVDRVRTLENGRAEQIADAGQQALALAREGVQRQDELLASANSILQIVGHSISHVPMQGRDCSRLLSEVASDSPWLKAISIADPQGRLTCASNPALIGTQISGYSYFQKALNGAGKVASEAVTPRVGAQPAFMLAFGKRGLSGAVEAVVAMQVEMQWLAQIAARAERRPGSATLVLDKAGVVLAGYPQAEAWTARDLTGDPLAKDVAARSEGATVAAAFQGARRIWGYVALPGIDGHLLVGADEREVLSRIDQDLTLAYVQLSLIVLVVLLGAWIFGEHAILRPIRALTRQAELIGRGNLNIRTAGPGWAAEFVPLTRALDSMASRLAVREDQLRNETDRFRELASSDGLTGLCNRRAFDTLLATEWQRCSGDHEPLALLMIDVDHFKRYNDTYGHLAGDACLRTVGRLLGSLEHATATPARFGGEEFALLIPGSREEEASYMAEVIRKAVQDLAIAHSETKAGVVTVSIGLATLVPGRSTPTETLITMADAALYASKRDRNCVTKFAPHHLAQAS